MPCQTCIFFIFFICITLAEKVHWFVLRGNSIKGELHSKIDQHFKRRIQK